MWSGALLLVAVSVMPFSYRIHRAFEFTVEQMEDRWRLQYQKLMSEVEMVQYDDCESSISCLHSRVVDEARA